MEIKNKIKKTVFVGLIYALLLPLAASAAVPPAIANFATNIQDIAWMVGDALIVVGIIYIGILFLTSSGNEERLGKAKKGLVWVIIGTAIILGFDAFIGIAKGLMGIG